jgi:anthranilate synthase component I
MTRTLTTTSLQMLADTVTPVTLYLRVRDRYPGSLLLESADYRGSENSISYLCINPLASIRAEGGEIIEELPNGDLERSTITDRRQVPSMLQRFLHRFSFDCEPSIAHALFGYVAYDAVKYFEDISLRPRSDNEIRIPDLFYTLFEFVVVVDHFKDTLSLLHNHAPSDRGSKDRQDALRRTLFSRDGQSFPFRALGDEESDLTDGAHAEMIERCKKHIRRGDVFQIVPSRRFSQRFSGDEFNVYRALRSINPSPFLFYFDYRSFKIFGSSPETQLWVKGGEAAIFPIAGTYPRAGALSDGEIADKLLSDPKENAEHVMLVDLARNDLSRHCRDVRVEVFKEIQFYSHVVHLVSKVRGTLKDPTSMLEIFAATFPAGTLSGAPKYRAMQLIDDVEESARSFYGGAIGLFSPAGECVHAILIRSFLSQNGKLYRQAGGGLVVDSEPETEVREVINKLMALKRAVAMAEEIA